MGDGQRCKYLSTHPFQSKEDFIFLSEEIPVPEPVKISLDQLLSFFSISQQRAKESKMTGLLEIAAIS